MIVRFKSAWFAPTRSRTLNPIQSTSGRLYRGMTTYDDVPDALKDILPKDAEILDAPSKAPKKKAKESKPQLQDFDQERGLADEFAIRAEADAK